MPVSSELHQASSALEVEAICSPVSLLLEEFLKVCRLHQWHFAAVYFVANDPHSIHSSSEPAQED